jgi:RNA polymerase sigma-70 factor (ECF subfamily)
MTRTAGSDAVDAADAADPTDAAFAALSDVALRRTYGLAGYLLGNASDAEDATQEAMARAWRARATLRDAANFDAWLDRILVNACRDRLRRRRLVQTVDLKASADIEARDPFREFLARDELAAALEALTADQRVVVVLRFWQDLSLEQISDRLDWPLGTVKSRLHHAMAAMKKRLERDAGHELREVAP